MSSSYFSQVSTHALLEKRARHTPYCLCWTSLFCGSTFLKAKTWEIVSLPNIRLMIQVTVTCLRRSMQGHTSSDLHLLVLGDQGNLLKRTLTRKTKCQPGKLGLKKQMRIHNKKRIRRNKRAVRQQRNGNQRRKAN